MKTTEKVQSQVREEIDYLIRCMEYDAERFENKAPNLHNVFNTVFGDNAKSQIELFNSYVLANQTYKQIFIPNKKGTAYKQNLGLDFSKALTRFVLLLSESDYTLLLDYYNKEEKVTSENA